MTKKDDSHPGQPSDFRELGLPESFLKVLAAVGYETPSPIQRATIPHLLGGRDLIGQAQTGTGKTAAFALPILVRLDLAQKKPQALVLTPTRELAIQVAEAFHRYAAGLPGFHVVPVYGGQGYGPQLAALQRGVHVVVGTPGRIIDHLGRKTLDLSAISFLVLDEADEMLRMGFQEEVESILSTTPATRQTALFSATMPAAIRKIAQVHLRNPVEVTIDAKPRAAEKVRQRYCLVSGGHKLDAITRILATETFDAMLIFTRTKLGTDELAEKLGARGFEVGAIHGDILQAQRERVVAQLKEGKIDLLVATDVAARGLDVERISHVLNYDVPNDIESYVHRIGRTGRAGRSGEAIVFVSPRERNLLRTIEQATKQPIEQMELPSLEAIKGVRIAKFHQKITETLAAGGLEPYEQIVLDYEREHNVPPLEIASALARLAQGEEPSKVISAKPAAGPKTFVPPERPANRPHPPKFDKGRASVTAGTGARPAKDRVVRAPDPGFALYRIEVGRDHGVLPGNIVGAIANEAGLTMRDIGRVDIFDDHSIVALPAALPPETITRLKTVWVSSQRLRITRQGEPPDRSAAPGRAYPRPKNAAPSRYKNDRRPPGGGHRPGGKPGKPYRKVGPRPK